MTVEQITRLTGQSFEHVVAYADGDVAFCVPIPGANLPYGTDDDGNLIISGPTDAWVEAWDKYMAGFRTPKREYRTKAKAGTTDRLPLNIPSITRYPYENSLTFRPCDGNHMVTLGGDITRDLEYKDGKLFYRGMEISKVDQDGQLYSQGTYDMPVATPEHGFPSSDTDLETLRFLYGIILLKYSEDIEDIVQQVEDDPIRFLSNSISIYRPDPPGATADVSGSRMTRPRGRRVHQ